MPSMSTQQQVTMITYDPEIDALAIEFSGMADGASVRQDRLEGGRAVDYDTGGRPIAVEVLGASRGFSLAGLPYPELVAAAAAGVGIRVR